MKFVPDRFGRHGVRVGFGLALLLLSTADAMAQVSRVSGGLNGATPNGNSGTGRHAVSANGQFVAFTSAASNLVPADTNNSTDVFVRDLHLQNNGISRVSLAAGSNERVGNSSLLALSGDGRFVLFRSEASLVTPDQLLCGFGTEHCFDLYVHDRDFHETTRVSINTNGAQFGTDVLDGAMSNSGRFVAFTASVNPPAQPVFLHDRQTRTTKQISPTFPGQSGFYGNVSISGDGSTIVFRGQTPPGTAVPPVAECPGCDVATFIYNRETDEMTTILPSIASVHAEGLAAPGDRLGLKAHIPLDVSEDGRYVLIEETLSSLVNPNPTIPFRRVLVRDRLNNRTQVTPWRTNRASAGLSTDGRHLVWQERTPNSVDSVIVIEDRVSGLVDRVVEAVQIAGDTPPISISRDGLVVAFASASRLAKGETDDFIDVFFHDRDPDSDAMPSGWERTFGLDPAQFNGNLDPDNDGDPNITEYQHGSHPHNQGDNDLFFAEGAVNEFFSTRFALVNEINEPQAVVLRYLGSSGTNSSQIVTLAPRSRSTVDFRFFGPLGESDFSTVIEAVGGVVADRTMQWDASGYGAHAEITTRPSFTWHLAEGATHGSFDLFYLLQNPHDAPVDVTINYLRPSPLPPVVKTYTVAPQSRRTIWVDAEGPELASTDVAASISATRPVIVERAMYATNPGQPFAAGHGGAGVERPDIRWFLAEGATGSFFDLFVLIGNPGDQDAQLTLSYLLPSGERFSKPYTVAAKSRRTILIDGEDPRLLDTPVSIIVESTNKQPVVVERAMWWPQGNWHEAHISAGATDTNTQWAFADGQIGVESATGNIVETYVLIANTSDQAGTAEIRLLMEGGAQPVTRTVALPANSRVNVPISSLFPPNANVRFGGQIETTVPVVVERAMYWTVNGVIWSAGTVALASSRS